MKPVLDWVKSNVLIVVFAAVAILSLALGWWFSGALNASVRAEATTRGAKINELASLERSAITLNLPGREPRSVTAVINQQILDQFREIAEAVRADSDRVRTLAVERNRGRHAVVADRVFPEPPATERETTPFRLHKAITASYEQLLAEVNVGMPPPASRVAEDLSRREIQFIQSTLKKPNRESLDERERKELEEELVRSRLAIYGEQAQRLTFYASLAQLELPASPEGRALPSLGEMYDWQWRYWITRDLLEAFVDASAAANGGTPGSVIRSPVKRLLSLRVEEVPWASARRPPAGSGTQRGGFGGLGGFGGGEESPGVDGEGGAPAEAAAPADTALDFKASFTGRTTNGTFDVRRVEVRLVAATSQLPTVFDALARQNFITILDARIQPADPFQAAAEGFIYGREPVSNVVLQLETVWLRDWTVPLMPPEVRAALGASVPAQASSESSG